MPCLYLIMIPSFSYEAAFAPKKDMLMRSYITKSVTSKSNKTK